MLRNHELALQTGNARERLEAARAFAASATADDIPLLQDALRRETVSWVRRALRIALERAGAPEPGLGAVVASDLEQDAVDDVYAEAIEETAGRLTHEIAPLVGAARLYAELETPDFDNTRLKRKLNQLEEMLDAIRTLSRAAAAPRLAEFNLAEVVGEIVADTPPREGVSIEATGRDPLLVVGDPTLVRLVVQVGLNNSAEATIALTGDQLPALVVRWDETDIDYWVAVLDRGVGLPPTASQIFGIGVTGKAGHLGMGLSLARRAAQSLRGNITLTPRRQSGVQFMFRWPRPELDML